MVVLRQSIRRFCRCRQAFRVVKGQTRAPNSLRYLWLRDDARLEADCRRLSPNSRRLGDHIFRET